MTNTSILTLDSVSLILPDGRPLFTELNESFDLRRTGLVGRNGVGKSLLAQLLAGLRAPSHGRCLRHGTVRYLDQQVIRHSASVAELAGIDKRLAALERIEAGSCDSADFDRLGERWDLREQFQALLQRHGLGHLHPHYPTANLSGGQAMSVALLGTQLEDADYLILDEPSNHLDVAARERLQQMIQAWPKGLLVISHDRALLAHMQRIVELSSLGLESYGGNYAFYRQQQAMQAGQAQQQLARLKHERERQTRELQRQRDNLARHQASAARNARQSNQAKILLDRQQQRSQATAGRRQHALGQARADLDQQVRQAAERVARTQDSVFHAPPAQRPGGREVLAMEGVRLPYGTPATLNLRLCLGQRMALVGGNGSGKSTLLRVIMGEQSAIAGQLRSSGEIALLDQHCSRLPATQSALEHLGDSNPGLPLATRRTRLAQLGLDAARCELPSALLSGGERLKAALAAVLYRERPVDLLLLDEPSNHLDLPSLQALEDMLRQFDGALLVASHDQLFLQALGVADRLLL